MKKILSLILLAGTLFGQTYVQGDYVSDFGAEICYNGDGDWSWETDGQNKVVFIASFATW